MSLIAKIAAAFAAIVHILFFTMESLMWHTPKVQKIFHIAAENVEATSLLAFNQGFYNLFLATGSIFALILLAKGKEKEGTTLLVFTSLCMLGAAIVLHFSALDMTRGVMIQGIAPAITLIFISRKC